MKKNSFLNDILQNTSCPQGFWGRMILRGMNCFHASLAHRGMKQVDWRPEWNVLDIGCGGRRQREASAEAVSAGKSLRHGPVGGERRLRPQAQCGRTGPPMFHTAGRCLLPALRGRGLRCRYGLRDRLFLVFRQQGAGRSLPRDPERGLLSHQSGSERPLNSERRGRSG